MAQRIKRFFTLDEAAKELPWVQEQLEQARQELYEQYDAVVLAKRLYALRYAERFEGQDEAEKALSLKVEAFEEAVEAWAKRFAKRGLILKDVTKGLVDFPYKTADGDVLLLCWKRGEEAILYFHEVNEGFRGRKPISLLPE
jgi:hypothetical protein